MHPVRRLFQRMPTVHGGERPPVRPHLQRTDRSGPDAFPPWARHGRPAQHALRSVQCVPGDLPRRHPAAAPDPRAPPRRPQVAPQASAGRRLEETEGRGSSSAGGGPAYGPRARHATPRPNAIPRQGACQPGRRRAADHLRVLPGRPCVAGVGGRARAHRDGGGVPGWISQGAVVLRPDRSQRRRLRGRRGAVG